MWELSYRVTLYQVLAIFGCLKMVWDVTLCSLTPPHVCPALGFPWNTRLFLALSFSTPAPASVLTLWSQEALALASARVMGRNSLPTSLSKKERKCIFQGPEHYLPDANAPLTSPIFC